MAQQIQVRRDTAANWTSADPILAQGEMGFEVDTNKGKFGDGTTAWTSLPYFGGSSLGTVTSVAALTLGTTGTDLSSTVANSTSTPVITLNVPTASASNRGALSASDWTAFNAKEDASNKATDFSTVNNTLYPTVQATKTYADGLVAGLLDYRGGYDASVNTFPTTGGSGTAGAILKGDMFIISVAGTLGGTAVQVGDSLIASVDTPGQTASNWNILNANISYVPEDVANKDATGGYAGLTLFKINFKNALNTFISFFTNANTASRTYTFQDRDGIIADDTDLGLKTAKVVTANRQTASYTIVLTDADKLVEMNVAGANNLTIPLNSSVAFPTGTQILIAQYGAGQTTVVATGGVTIRSANSANKLNKQYSGASLIKIATDEWYLFGDITA